MQLANRVSRDASILEIGAGFGGNLLALAEAKFAAGSLSAVEISPDAASQIKRTVPGVEVFTGSLQQFRKAPQFVSAQYDAIILSHVLEHFVEPHHELAIVHDLLKQDGVVLILVPDLELDRRFLRQFTTPHTHYFSCRTLEALLNNTGFVVVERINSAGEIFFIASPTRAGRSLSRWNTGDSREVDRQLARVRRAWLVEWPYQFARLAFHLLPTTAADRLHRLMGRAARKGRA